MGSHFQKNTPPLQAKYHVFGRVFTYCNAWLLSASFVLVIFDVEISDKQFSLEATLVKEEAWSTSSNQEQLTNRIYDHLGLRVAVWFLTELVSILPCNRDRKCLMRALKERALPNDQRCVLTLRYETIVNSSSAGKCRITCAMISVRDFIAS